MCFIYFVYINKIQHAAAQRQTSQATHVQTKSNKNPTKLKIIAKTAKNRYETRNQHITYQLSAAGSRRRLRFATAAAAAAAAAQRRRRRTARMIALLRRRCGHRLLVALRHRVAVVAGAAGLRLGLILDLEALLTLQGIRGEVRVTRQVKVGYMMTAANNNSYNLVDIIRQVYENTTTSTPQCPVPQTHAGRTAAAVLNKRQRSIVIVIVGAPITLGRRRQCQLEFLLLLLLRRRRRAMASLLAHRPCAHVGGETPP